MTTNVTLVTTSKNMFHTIALAARECKNTKDKSDTPIGSKKFGPVDRKLIEHCIDHLHFSVLEHGSFTFELSMSRVAQQQSTRHRLASFSIQSGRAVEPTDGFWYPGDEPIYEKARLSALGYYKELLAAGVAKEDARYVLPMGMMSPGVITANIRELRHIIAERTCKHAQTEIANIAAEMRNILKAHDPTLVYKAEKFYWGCPEAKTCGDCIRRVDRGPRKVGAAEAAKQGGGIGGNVT